MEKGQPQLGWKILSYSPEVFSGNDISVERELSGVGEQSRSQEINVEDAAGAEGLVAYLHLQHIILS